MAKSLIKQIEIKKNQLDGAAIQKMRDELTFLSLHKELLGRILIAERAAKKEVLRNMEELAAVYHDLKMIRITAYTPQIANAFDIETELTEYDTNRIKTLVDWPLLASEDVNYFAAVRAHYAAAESAEYGPDQEWVVWFASEAPAVRPARSNERSYGSSGPALVKMRAYGRLSNLYLKFPDAATALIRRDAGVETSNARPIFMIRASALEAFKEGHSYGRLAIPF